MSNGGVQNESGGSGVPKGAVRSQELTPTRGSDTTRSPLRRNWMVIAGIAAAAAGVLALQALLHGHYSAVDEYDDGVYFGASVELLHGVFAYRNFAFIQPPMITVWMLPFAAMSSVIGTASAMETARFFVDLVTVTNVVLVGALVRRRSTLQVMAGTGVMAFSQGTIRASQTILLEPFLILACLLAFLCLMDGEEITSSPRRLWWCGIFLGVAGATKVWAIFPLLAVLIVVRRSRSSPRPIVFGAFLGFVACCLPFIVGAPIAFFQQVVLTQALRNGGGFPVPQRLADLSGIPGLGNVVASHPRVSLIVLSVLVVTGIGAFIARRRPHPRNHWTPLERLAGWSTAIVGLGLLGAPTYYYHYSGFMAPFVGLVASSAVVALRAPLNRVLFRRSLLFPIVAASLAVPSAVALLLGATAAEVVTLPVAPHVGDTVSDAIPSGGCVLYSNPTLALLDNRFTADVSGCPRVIDWLGEERVLDNGQSVSGSDTTNRHLQEVLGRWIQSSDAVVLKEGNLGLDSANKNYLTRHFDRERHIPRGLRIYVREPPHRPPDADHVTERPTADAAHLARTRT